MWSMLTEVEARKAGTDHPPRAAEESRQQSSAQEGEVWYRERGKKKRMKKRDPMRVSVTDAKKLAPKGPFFTAKNSSARAGETARSGLDGGSGKEGHGSATNAMAGRAAGTRATEMATGDGDWGCEGNIPAKGLGHGSSRWPSRLFWPVGRSWSPQPDCPHSTRGRGEQITIAPIGGCLLSRCCFCDTTSAIPSDFARLSCPLCHALLVLRHVGAGYGAAVFNPLLRLSDQSAAT